MICYDENGSMSKETWDNLDTTEVERLIKARYLSRTEWDNNSILYQIGVDIGEKGGDWTPELSL